MVTSVWSGSESTVGTTLKLASLIPKTRPGGDLFRPKMFNSFKNDARGTTGVLTSLSVSRTSSKNDFLCSRSCFWESSDNLDLVSLPRDLDLDLEADFSIERDLEGSLECSLPLCARFALFVSSEIDLDLDSLLL